MFASIRIYLCVPFIIMLVMNRSCKNYLLLKIKLVKIWNKFSTRIMFQNNNLDTYPYLIIYLVPIYTEHKII